MKIIVLAENETLFLPNLVAKLANNDLIETIVIYSPPFSFKRSMKHFARMLDMIGTANAVKSITSVLMAKIADFVFPHRFYSLEKVGSVFHIPVERVSKLHSKKLYKILEKVSHDVVFAQVHPLIKKRLLKKTKFLNKHCAPLPSYKGVFPVFWAMLHGEQWLGITIHEMDGNFDTGRILSQAVIPNKNLTFFEAHHELFDIAADLIIELAIQDKRRRVKNDFKSSYYSFPSSIDGKKFVKKNKFGFDFRLHKIVASADPKV